MQIISTTSRYVSPYIAVKPVQQSKSLIRHISMLPTFLPGRQHPDEFHTTIVHDHIEYINQNVKKNIMPALTHRAVITGVEIFSNIENMSMALVLLLESESLHDRFKFFHEDMEYKNKFPVYRPHVTIAKSPWTDERVDGFVHGMSLYEIAADEIREQLDKETEELFIFLQNEKLKPVKM